MANFCETELLIMMETPFPATSFLFSQCLEMLSLLSFLYCAVEMVLVFFCLSCFHVPQEEQTGRPSPPESTDCPLP